MLGRQLAAAEADLHATEAEAGRLRADNTALAGENGRLRLALLAASGASGGGGGGRQEAEGGMGAAVTQAQVE